LFLRQVKAKENSKYNIEKSINILINDINAQYDINITMGKLQNQVYFVNCINENLLENKN
jgi:hypothetical protein